LRRVGRIVSQPASASRRACSRGASVASGAAWAAGYEVTSPTASWRFAPNRR